MHNPNPELCKEIDLGFVKIKQCKNNELRTDAGHVVTSNLPDPLTVPGNVAAVERVVERETAENVTSRPLNSIIGNWFASGINSGQQQFSASFTFENSSQYSSIVNLNGALSSPLFGKFAFSLNQEVFTLQPYGGTTEVYKITETTSNSFKVAGVSGTMTFVRIST